MFILLLIPLVSCFFGRSEKNSKCSIATETDKCSTICGISEQARCVILDNDKVNSFVHCTCLETAASIDLKERDKCKGDLENLLKLKASFDENVKNITKNYEAQLKKRDKEIAKLKGEIQVLKEKPKQEKKKNSQEKPKEGDSKKEESEKKINKSKDNNK